MIEPSDFLRYTIIPATEYLESITGVPSSERDYCILLSIAVYEGGLQKRAPSSPELNSGTIRITRGSSVSPYGLYGMLRSEGTSKAANVLLEALDISKDLGKLGSAVQVNDFLAVCLARIIINGIGAPAPELAKPVDAYDYYRKNWICSQDLEAPTEKWLIDHKTARNIIQTHLDIAVR